MTDHFAACLAHTLFIEGEFVNNPLDRGGPTKFGISTATLSAWRRRPVAADDVRFLEMGEATAIYRAWYWNALGCDRIFNLSTVAILFDAAVLFGVRPAAVCAQRALRASGFPTLEADGHVGPATRDALNTAEPRVFALAFARELRLRVDMICTSRPSDQAFRAGWLSRVDGYPKIQIGERESNVS